MEIMYSRYITKLNLIKQNSLSIEDTEGLEEDVARIYSYITWMCPFRPEFSLSSVFGCACFLVIVTPFHYLELVTDYFYDLYKDFLFDYLSNPSRGIDAIDKRLDHFIHDMMASNANYAAILVKLRNKMAYIDRKSPDMTSTRGRVKFAAANPSETIDCKYLDSSYHAINKQLKIVRDEYIQMETLQVDKSSIWPCNRTEDYLARVKRLWTICALTILGMAETSTTVILCPIVFYTHRIDKALRPKSLLRSLFIFETFFFTMIMNSWYVLPNFNLIVSQIDLKKLISGFHSRVKTFLELTTELRQLNDIKNHANDNNQEYHHLLNREHLQFLINEKLNECHQVAIEAYIDLRYLIIQTKSLRFNVHGVLHQGVFSCLSIALITLLCANYFDRIYPAELLLLRATGIFIILLLNLVLFTYAALNALSFPIIKHIWSILHCSALDDQRDNEIVENLIHKQSICFYDYAHHHASIHQLPNQIPFEWTIEPDVGEITTREEGKQAAILDTDNSHLLSETLNFRATLISPHIYLLWIRLIHHEQIYLIEHFTCRMFRVIPLNYSSLLAMNFWLLSFFIVYLVAG